MYIKQLENYYQIECVDSQGNVKWTEDFANLVTQAGLNDSLDKHLKGSSYTAAWYVGLSGSSPTFAAGDTMSSHAGWVEFTTYSESVRQDLTLGSVTSGSVSNTASKATFSINGDGAVGGAFVTSDSAKSGTDGVLYGGGAFTGDRTVANGDSVTVTVTCTASAS